MAASLAVIATLFTAAPSWSDDDSKLGPDASAAQNTLMTFNGWLMQQPKIYDAGYVASIDDPESQSITLLWSGGADIPSDVKSQAAAADISLTLKPWPLSYSQINKAAETLDNSKLSLFASADYKVADVVGIDPSFPGITVEGEFSDNVSDTKAATAVLEKEASAYAGVPVRVVTGIQTFAAAGRNDDVDPFFAGGYMINPTTQDTCSSGFTVIIGGVAHVTTARHCAAAAYFSRDAQSGLEHNYRKGSSTVVNAGAARYLGSSGMGVAWMAGQTSTNNRRIVGYADLAIGDSFCTDGGNSGMHCLMKVTNLSVWFDDGYGSFQTIEGVQQAADDIGAIQGDSGGPVVTRLGDVTQAKAAGMIQAVRSPTLTGAEWCGSARDLGDNLCSKYMLFTSMRTIVNGIPGGSLAIG